jgi:UDP-N-acetylglucosamine transferase subunit ALG13
MVMLGTNPYPFTRLVTAIDDIARRQGLDVFMQTGNTPAAPRNCRWQAFLSHDDVVGMIEACEVLVTQGGAGSISDGLRMGKRVIAVPRYRHLGECPDCQEELVRALERLGCVIGVYDVAKLEEALLSARAFVPRRLPENRIPSLIALQLQQWCLNG